MSLEDVAQESIVSLLEALEIVLEDFVFRLEHLHLSQRQCRIQPVLDLIQVEDLPIDHFNVQVFDQSGEVVLAQRQRVGRHHAVVHVGVGLLPSLVRPNLFLDVVVDFIADDRVHFMDNLLIRVQVQFTIVKADYQLGIAAVQCLVNRCVDL